MQLATIQTSKVNTGTCPHGLPIGSCPICNGMSGGGMKKADFSAKPGEMSWNECAAIGAFLKAQKLARETRQQDALNFAQKAAAFQNALMNSSMKAANFTALITQNLPSMLAKPVNFVMNNIVGGVLRSIANAPVLIANVMEAVKQKLADITDKLTAIFGELKASAEKKISDVLKNLKKKIKSLFSIFSPQDSDNNEKQIDETKKAFRLKTFIHDLYGKITKKEDYDNKSAS